MASKDAVQYAALLERVEALASELRTLHGRFNTHSQANEQAWRAQIHTNDMLRAAILFGDTADLAEGWE